MLEYLALVKVRNPSIHMRADSSVDGAEVGVCLKCAGKCVEGLHSGMYSQCVSAFSVCDLHRELGVSGAFPRSTRMQV